MNVVQLHGNIPFEKYQMAVELLRVIGLEVQTEEITEKEELPMNVIQGIEKGKKDIEQGRVIRSEDVRKKAQAICEN